MNYITKQSGNTSIIVIIVIVLVIAAGALFLFSNNAQAPEDAMIEEDTMMQEESMIEDNSTMEEDTMMDEEAMMEDVLEIEVEGGAFYYDPDIIEAKVGQTVRVTFNSVDMQHDFDIDELDLDTEVIPGGESLTFEFTPTEVGEFEYYCSVGSHREEGMVGTLVVTE